MSVEIERGGRVHLLKLSAGCDSVETLAAWQEERLRAHGRVFHRTRMMPRRREMLIAGGSIYWVIKGLIQARQPILDIEPVDLERPGTENHEEPTIERHTFLILEPGLRRTLPRAQRAFQGWRYLKDSDAPADLAASGGGEGRPRGFEEMPQSMLRELADLGLV